MKKRIAFVAGFGVLAFGLIPTVFAAKSVGQTMPANPEVWVARDVTTAFHYTLQYKRYDAQHHIVSEQIVTPPAGSLVEFEQVPLSQAKARGDVYVPLVAGEAKATLHQQLNQLHDELFKKLHGNSALAAVDPASTTLGSLAAMKNAPLLSTSPAMPATAAGSTTTDVTGTFTDYSGDTWSYDITYASGSIVTVTNYELYQKNGSGAAYFNYNTWDGSTLYPFPSHTLIPTSYPGLSQASYYEKPSGYPYTTVVSKGSAAYSGWVTLY